VDVEGLRDVVEGGPLFAYSWTADGVLAAIVGYSIGRGGLLGLSTVKPDHGLLESIAIASRRHRGVALLGLAWSGGDVDLLANMVLGPVGVVDVHWAVGRPRRPNVAYANPSPRGDPRGYWPSTTLVLSSALNVPHSFLAAAGVVAVLGELAIGNRMYQNMMVRAGLDPRGDFRLAWECSMQAYGVAAAGDPHVHGEVPRSLVEASPGDPCRALLADGLIAGLRARAEAGLAEAEARNVGAADGFRLFEARGWGRHMFALARALAARHGRVIIGYEDELGGERGACAWTTRARDPVLAALTPQLRARGLAARGLYQGPANLVCVHGVDPGEAAGYILEAYRERFSSSRASV